eukprot:8241074-Pyramimonas_sp.AAC.1
MPIEIVHRPLWDSQCNIVCIKRPDSGHLSGHVFTDGSGHRPTCPLSRRAGWALTQLNDDGS